MAEYSPFFVYLRDKFSKLFNNLRQLFVKLGQLPNQVRQQYAQTRELYKELRWVQGRPRALYHTLAGLYRKLTRRQKQNIVIGLSTTAILVLVVVLFAMTAPRSLPSGPPEFLYSIYGNRAAGNALSAPLGVATPTDVSTPPFGLIRPLPGVTDPREQVFIANTGKAQVQVYNTDGGFLKSFLIPRLKSPKKKKAAFSYPVGLAVYSKNIYVADIRSPFLFVFCTNGNFRYQFPKLRSPKPPLQKPLAVTFAGDRLYVIEGFGQEIKIFDLKGRLIRKFGSAGDKPGQFQFPNGIAVGEDGRIYVADSGNSRLQIFDAKGKLLSVTDGLPNVRLVRPTGIAIDPWQRLHIVDTFARQVNVFDKNGRFLFSYGTKGGGDGELNFPSGIAIDPLKGRIFIADRANNRISVWDYPN